MVKVLEIRSGKIRDYEKRYADIMVKLGHVSVIKEPEPASTLKADMNKAAKILEENNLKIREDGPGPDTVFKPIPAMTTEAAPETVTRPKRVYKRRDMKAESE